MLEDTGRNSHQVVYGRVAREVHKFLFLGMKLLSRIAVAAQGV
jgi:hypothetical protein